MTKVGGGSEKDQMTSFMNDPLSERTYTFVCSIPNDGPGFSRSSLSISKERAVETPPGIVQDPSTNIFENFFLFKKKQGQF